MRATLPRTLLGGALVLTAALGVIRGSGAQSIGDRAIRFARAAPVATLDSTLAGPTLHEWLVRLVDAGKLEYEVDDCGEQTGHPQVDRGRDFPACVSAYGTLQDGSQVSVSVRVGTLQTGVMGTPTVAMVTVRVGNDVRFLPSLSALAAWLGHRRIPNPLDSLSPSLQTS